MRVLLFFNKITLGIGLVILFFIHSNTSEAATINAYPLQATRAPGESFTVFLELNPEGEAINAAQGVLHFNPSILAVSSVSKDGSFFSLWTEEPTFSNSEGVLSFGGGSPTPANTTSRILTVTFVAKAPGKTDISIDDGMALQANGDGSNRYKKVMSASVVVTPPAPQKQSEPVSDQNQIQSADVRQAPKITPPAHVSKGNTISLPFATSSVFVSDDIWINVVEGEMTWMVPQGVSKVAVGIATSSNTEPDRSYPPSLTSFSLNGNVLHDGEQYFMLQFKDDRGWGEVFRRRIRIDTIPPEPYTLAVTMNGTSSIPLFLDSRATDTLSGIDHVDLKIDNHEPISISPSDISAYPLPNLSHGTHTILVTAYDKAGNAREETLSIAMIEPTPTSRVSDEINAPLKDLILLLLLLLSLSLLWVMIENKKRATNKEKKLIREAREVEDQSQKIFSALREEIYEQIGSLSQKKRQTKKEKEVIEKLENALSISETLLEKEIKDVRNSAKQP